jgi:predicted secreted Zn-dependent protease
MGLGMPVLPARADGVIRRHVGYYEITGTTPAGLRASLDAAGPKGTDGERWDGYTSWEVDWHFRLREEPGACAVAEVDTELRIVVTLPRWEPPPDANRKLVRRWRKYLRGLEHHEAGHEEIARDTAAVIRRHGANLEPNPSCAELRKAGDAAAGKAIVAARQEDSDYDRVTRHGAKQGARFP